MLALARHLQARLLQRRDHASAVLHGPVHHAHGQVLPEYLTGVRLHPQPSPQPRRIPVRQVRRRPVQPRPLGIVWTTPVVLVVEEVAQRIEGLLPARRRDVQAPPRLQVAPRRENVHVHPAVVVAVQDGGPGVAIGVQASPRRMLEGVDHCLDLRVVRCVLRRPGNHPRRVPVRELQRVGHGRHLFRIPTQDLDLGAALAARIELTDQVGRRRRRQASAPCEELDVHQDSGSPPGRASPRSSRSMTTRWEITSTASAADW